MEAACRSKRSSSGWSDASCRSCKLAVIRQVLGRSRYHTGLRDFGVPAGASSVIASRCRPSYAIHDSDRQQAHRDGTARQRSTGCSPPPRRKSGRLKQSGIRRKGSPVFTVGGQYTSRGWTEWTQGFQFGSAILQFDATGDKEFLEIGRTHTVNVMAPHVTHVGVHDHGFNNVSTYGNLLRLMNEGCIPDNAWERRFYELALEMLGRGAGCALDDASRTAADTSTRSTVRIRCLSIRSARCARSLCRTSSGTC